MNELFVPYQEALELKELGFDEPCFCYYDEEDNAGRIYEYANCNRNVTGGRACYNDNFLSVTNSQLDRYGAFSAKDEGGENSFSRWTAPTFSQAFRWFRKKYNFHSWLKPFVDFDDNDKLLYEYEILIIKEGRYNNDMETGIFTNPEEAELACLRKLIEIVKNTKT
jgi:hypothetical protein